MSVETSCSLDTFIIPRHSGFCDSAVKISFISSTLVYLFAKKVRSISEPTGTGTLTATPSKIPFISGMAFAAEMAAPVLEGEMSIVPARPFANLWRRVCPQCLAMPCKREWCLKPLFNAGIFCQYGDKRVIALVVQALEVILNWEMSPAFTLGVSVSAISSLTGAVITALLAPASKWALALS